MSKSFPKALSVNARHYGQKTYLRYVFFSALSYYCMTDYVVTMSILSMGGNGTWAGIASAAAFIGLPAMAIGYKVVQRKGVCWNLGFFWACRSTAGLLMVLSPTVLIYFGETGALLTMMSGVFLFYLFRSSGMISVGCIIAEITTSSERGGMVGNSFLREQLALLLVMGSLIYFFSGEYSGMTVYQGFFIVGCFAGWLSSWFMFKIPESASYINQKNFNLLKELKWCWHDKEQRFFTSILVMLAPVETMGRVFLVLVVKEGYGIADQQAFMLILISVFGGISGAYICGFFLDLLGYRTLLILTSMLQNICLLAIVLYPPETFSMILFGVYFFSSGIIHTSVSSSAPNYFVTMTDVNRRLPQSIIISSVSGALGGTGIVLISIALAFLKDYFPPEQSNLLYLQVFGAIFMVATSMLLLLLVFSPRRSEVPRTLDSLGALISPSNWSAIFAIKQANHLRDEGTETRALDFILKAGSAVYGHQLLEYLQSPSFAVRDSALRSLVTVRPERDIADILIEDVKNSPFTTSYHSAYWLGRWGVERAIPVLRDSLTSNDHALAARSIHALVDIGDKESAQTIKELFLAENHPLMLIEAAYAFRQWSDEYGVDNFGIMLKKYGQSDHLQVKRALGLSMAKQLGLYSMLYRDLFTMHCEVDYLEQEWIERYSASEGWVEFKNILERKNIAPPLRNYLAKYEADYSDWFSQPLKDHFEEHSVIDDLMDGALFLCLLIAPSKIRYASETEYSSTPWG